MATVGKNARQPGGRVRRREFGKTVLVSLLPGVAGAGAREPVDVAALEPRDVVADLHALDDRYGGGTVADLAERRLHSITQQLKNVSLTLRAEARVHRVVGALSLCAGWLAHDAGRHDRAGKLYKEGLYYAHVANDRGIRLHALANMSMLANETGRAGDAIRLAQAALSDARRADPRLRSLLTMRVARAASERGDTQMVRDRHGEAWRLLEQATTSAAPTSWFRFFDDMELTGLEGICAGQMGRDAEAARSFRYVIDHHGTYARNRAVYAARLAESLAKARQLDEAMSVIHAELPLFTQVTSAGVLERLTAADHALKPYVRVSGVRECREIIAGLADH